MITRRNSIWFIPLLLLITFPLWKIPVATFLTPRGGYDPEFVEKTDPQHNFSMVKVNIQQSEDGEKTADISATEALTSKKPNEYVLKNVQADIVGEDGKIINIVGDVGLYNSSTRQLKLSSNVVVTSKADNFTMATNQLYYFDIDRKVHCPGQTDFHGDGIDIRGSSFDYNIKNGFYRVGGRVFSTVKP